MTQTALLPDIHKTIAGFDITTVSSERKAVLQPLVDFIQAKSDEGEAIRLNFICTHNSRRSHLAQVWAQVAAAYYGVINVTCYSGGTETTAMFPMVAQVLRKSGLQVKAISSGDNPVYIIKYAENELPIIGFSKSYFDDFNPESGFAAIMTCSQADGGCPFISGAEKRIPITFDDPKAFDGTPQQEEKYLERSTQIATEMFYVFSMIAK
ncbi:MULTISPECIES: protein-tyrosine-phosphatase [unclassified Flavobacterium]|uniref:protein-tyrosine-phosphatase n=1 Tax=unclassified Flavobacterium TaxID=196869 RepID=UPI001F14022D|nr:MULTISPECIES: protein-tyrosine-phosphatase [unclassified Flavobacterium]UMY67036.1 protein-tyrosine-phosphatase [Flavobacterium sp. HJ-32-4]